jgi:FMN-dependent NADH-azoreductase
MGLQSEETLLDNHEMQLKAAFDFMGVHRLHVVRNMADLASALEFLHTA